VKAATGEIVTSEDLGGAIVHGRHSGVSDYIAENEEEALYMGRNIVANVLSPCNQASHAEIGCGLQHRGATNSQSIGTQLYRFDRSSQNL
jgi:acetyl-CoA carboxylase carboxyltransferase component